MPTPDKTIELFSQQGGLIGLIVLGLFALLYYVIKEQGKERILFRDSLDKNTEVIREFSNHLQQILSVQFESRK